MDALEEAVVKNLSAMSAVSIFIMLLLYLKEVLIFRSVFSYFHNPIMVMEVLSQNMTKMEEI